MHNSTKKLLRLRLKLSVLPNVHEAKWQADKFQMQTTNRLQTHKCMYYMSAHKPGLTYDSDLENKQQHAAGISY